MKTRQPRAIDREIAKRLRIARIAAGVTQAGAADHLGITFQQVQKYESGDNRVSAGCLALLAQCYGRPVEWFFDGGTIGSEHITTKPIARARVLAKAHEALK